MSNNGFQLSDSCVPAEHLVANICSSTGYFGFLSASTGITSPSQYYYYCRRADGSYSSSVSLGLPTCNILPYPSVPTVADGLSLGWQAGAVLILVAVVLFLRKAWIA